MFSEMLNVDNYAKGRHKRQQKRRFLPTLRQRPSIPKLSKCSMNFFMVFLVALVIAYNMVALSSFREIGNVNKREVERRRMIGGMIQKTTNKKHVDSHRNDKLIDAGKDDEDQNDGNNDNNDIGNHVIRGNEISNHNNNRITIGVASTITGCESDLFIDGAAVMKYSLEKQSRNANSKFNYKSYIFYHPSAKKCALPLKDLGFTLLERQTPVRVEEIEGDDLRERIVGSGCCGEKELIKLEAFRLTEHPVVIQLDLDVIINKPMDDVLDFMINPEPYKKSPAMLAKIPIMWPQNEIPDDISLIFTKDYNVVAPKRHDKPYQGGFFVIKPSLQTYNEFLDIVRKGDYDFKKGWGNKVGPFYGGMTIQGLLPWYYQYLHPGGSVELNRCKYNNMSDKPHLERGGKKICRTNEEECEDCRFANADDVVTFHFTICQKPWNCLAYRMLHKDFKLCREMNRRWYNLRSELEASWGRNGTGTGTFKYDHYKGFCSTTGAKGYQPIKQNYEKPS